jgi:hypothetical protein
MEDHPMAHRLPLEARAAVHGILRDPLLESAAGPTSDRQDVDRDAIEG